MKSVITCVCVWYSYGFVIVLWLALNNFGVTHFKLYLYCMCVRCRHIK